MQKNKILKSIANNWKLEARLEESKYFFHYKEVNPILENKKCYVIGRKGAGKTAICNKIVSENSYNQFSEKLNFKNFPFNELYSLSNDKYTAPNQYITIWKYLIYSSICKLMVSNEAIDIDIRKQLEKLYPKNDIKQLARKVSEWTTAEFGASILGYGGNLKINREFTAPYKHVTWIEKVDILEDIIINYCDISKYYVVFDELDEDYRSVNSQQEIKSYINLLTSLFKAVQDVKATFSRTKLRIMPIVFLRDDIYALINDADKNKWSDLKIELEWNEEYLKQMLAYRISKEIDSPYVLKFKDAWNLIFQKGSITYGNKQTKYISTFEFITRNTQLRPRDYIKYIQACCEYAYEKGEHWISQDTIKHVDRAFSNYLRSEIIDEIYPLLPEIDCIFQIISNIRKQSFTGAEFTEEYNKYVKLGTITQKNINYVLDNLFNFSVIGNVDKHHCEMTYFKYLHTNMTYNIDENIVIHRGLLKSLQIF